jgi:hypothetical protein
MKQIAVVSKAVLLIVVLASLAACSGGTFFDPGHEAGSGSNGGYGYDYDDDFDWDDDDSNGDGSSISKPVKLSSNATYAQAIDKLDAIIAYCTAHPGTTNTGIKSGVQTLKVTISSLQNSWGGTTVKGMIDSINALIDELQ